MQNNIIEGYKLYEQWFSDAHGADKVRVVTVGEGVKILYENNRDLWRSKSFYLSWRCRLNYVWLDRKIKLFYSWNENLEYSRWFKCITLQNFFCPLSFWWNEVDLYFTLWWEFYSGDGSHASAWGKQFIGLYFAMSLFPESTKLCEDMPNSNLLSSYIRNTPKIKTET